VFNGIRWGYSFDFIFENIVYTLYKELGQGASLVLRCSDDNALALTMKTTVIGASMSLAGIESRKFEEENSRVDTAALLDGFRSLPEA